MSRAPLLLVGGALVLLQPAAGAVPAQPETHAARGRDDGLALLEQAARAARRLSYRGTQMVSFWSEGGSSSAVVEVAHEAGEGALLRVAPTPQTPGGAVYDDDSGEVPNVVGFAKGTLDLLAAHYDVGVEGPGEAAGRAAYVVVVRRPGNAPAARFWIDRRTKLPLRREVLDEAGRTIRESAFIQLRVGPALVSDLVREEAAPMPVATGAPVGTEALRAEGWHVPDRLGSGLEPVDARVTGEGDARTLHLTYSDGLSTMSLFEQKGVLDEASVAGWRAAEFGGAEAWVQDAFPRRVVWAGDGVVFTVVTDCPRAAVDELVGVLPHGNPGPGIVTRLGNGVERVASWVNPFG